MSRHFSYSFSDGVQSLLQDTDESDNLSIGGETAEQQILATIQELQKKLFEVKNESDLPQQLPNIELDNRLIMVSNRLPVSGGRDKETGEWKFKMSSGGLVTALQGTRDELNFIWVGWLGKEIAEEDQPIVRKMLMEQHRCLPVFIPSDIASKYYNGFSNDILWPLFHYVPLPMYKTDGERNFNGDLWEAYKQANNLFCAAVKSVYENGDWIWIHDYHLMRLPYELRQIFPECKIGWFLHTPFPSSEVYRMLPVRKDLLEGLVMADLVGFHTYDYARHFLSACTWLLEVEATPRGIEYQRHFMSVGVFPIGIDPSVIKNLLKTSQVQDRIKELKQTYEGRKVLLGVDRVDYIKGMPHRLLAFELFLTKYPEWRGFVTLVQIGVPSRTEVYEYQILSKRVSELVGRINGKFGTMEYTPVNYVNQSISQAELVAIYNLADVCLVTSIRDGMNLVSYEYVAAQIDKEISGLLVLSEFAGSAQSLGGALLVNPWNTEQIADSIHQALTMPAVEREIRQLKLRRYVEIHTASYWAKSFLLEFQDACKRREEVTNIPILNKEAVKSAYRRAKKRLIISDYDGTLTNVQSLPQLNKPQTNIIDIIKTLSQDPKNTVLILSGRERRVMEKWLGNVNVGLAAEHGFYLKFPGDTHWETLVSDVDTNWKNVVRPIMQYFFQRTPGTYIEDKEMSLSWHYHDADRLLATWQAKDMIINLEDLLTNMQLEIYQGNCVVEVRHLGATKAVSLKAVLRRMAQIEEHNDEVDFVFCIGDDQSDEDMFQTLEVLKQHRSSNQTNINDINHERQSSIPTDQKGNDLFEKRSPSVSSGTSNSTTNDIHRRNSFCPISSECQIFTVHVGESKSYANFYVPSFRECQAILSDFGKISKSLADKN